LPLWMPTGSVADHCNDAVLEIRVITPSLQMLSTPVDSTVDRIPVVPHTPYDTAHP